MSSNYSDKQIKFIQILRGEGNEWGDISDKFFDEFKEKRTSDALRKTYNRYQLSIEEINDDTLFKNLKTTHTAKNIIRKVKKENNIILEQQMIMNDFLKELTIIEKNNKIYLHKPIINSKKKKMKRTIVAHMADNHLGSIIHSETMGGVNSFNPDIAARRVAYYIEQVANYKQQHRKETDLVLVLNGDMLHGIIHGTDTDNVLQSSVQHALGLRIYGQAISYLSQKYSKVRVVCETGNHSRFLHKINKGRQTEEKWDSFETILFTSLKERFLEYPNVDFIIEKAPYTIIEIQGHKALITHGDTVLNVGQPGSSINVKSITTQVNSIASSLGFRIDMVLVGHVHKATYIVLDNGTHLIINGPLNGNDEYVQSLGILNSNPIQQIFEVTQDNVVGDMRFVRVDEGDNKTTLDKIIKLDKDFTF